LSSADSPRFPLDPESQWEALESRIHRLLETISRLQNANHRLTAENETLGQKFRETEGALHGATEDLRALHQKHGDAMEDLRQVKQHLQRIDNLASQLSLDGTSLSPEQRP